MKALSLVLLLFAGAALILVGCSDNSGPVSTPDDYALAAPASVPALGKSNPVVHSASGNLGFFFNGEPATFAFSAHRYADNSCDGEYQVCIRIGDKMWPKWHGKVLSLEVYGGNQAVIGGEEYGRNQSLGSYDVFVAIDNGEGQNAAGDKCTQSIVWTSSRTDAEQVWEMAPDGVVNRIIQDALNWGVVITAADVLVPIQHGNIQVQ